MRQNLIQKIGIPQIVVVLIAIVAPLILTGVNFSYGILILNFMLVYVVAVSGLDIVFGYSGQISLGHAAYYAIGAYGSVMLHEYVGIPVIFSMIISAVAASLIGIVIAYPASRLRNHFLALATIAFGEIVYQLVAQSPGQITGNFLGFFTDPVNLFGFEFDSNMSFYYFGLVVVVIFLLLKTNLVKSRTGRALIAIRENSAAADGMGINVTLYKVIGFAFSALYCGFAGGMYAHMVQFISPETFMYRQSVMFMTMLLFGGMGNLWGPIIGVITVTLLNEGLRALEEYQLFIYGALMLLVIIALPGGIFGKVKQLVDNTKSRRAQKNADVH